MGETQAILENDFLSGSIVKAQSGFFTVETAEGLIICELRGKLKRGRALGDLAALGDRVLITVLTDRTGIIEEIEKRKRDIVRLDPRPQGIYQQVLLANPDQAVFVFACAQPNPNLRMLDRFLVIAEKQRIPALIVANKIDLVGKKQAVAMFGFYEPIGYKVIYTSATSGAGIQDLKKQLMNRLSALTGPSGAGKSSLLNVIQPGIGLAVGGISSVNKGRHTTVVREIFTLDGNGHVADTPGWKSLALWDTQPEEMDAYFPELAPLVSKCRFNDCKHTIEPGCAVRAAVDAGRIHAQRYESYLRLRAQR